jgi:hypothetical protein
LSNQLLHFAAVMTSLLQFPLPFTPSIFVRLIVRVPLAEVSACLDLCSSFSLLKPLEIAEFKETVNHSYWQIKKLP